MLQRMAIKQLTEVRRNARHPDVAMQMMQIDRM